MKPPTAKPIDAMMLPPMLATIAASTMRPMSHLRTSIPRLSASPFSRPSTIIEGRPPDIPANGTMIARKALIQLPTKSLIAYLTAAPAETLIPRRERTSIVPAASAKSGNTSPTSGRTAEPSTSTTGIITGLSSAKPALTSPMKPSLSIAPKGSLLCAAGCIAFCWPG